MIDATNSTDQPKSHAALPLRAILTVIIVLVPVWVFLRLRRTPHHPETALIEPPTVPTTVPVETEPESPWDVEPTNLRELGAILLKEVRRIRFTETQRRALKILLALVVVCLPLLMLVGLPSVAQRPPFTVYSPFWSDEIYYWRQAASFQAVGLNTGYFTYGEQPAPVGNSYAWGMFVPVIYGALGKILGWSLYSIPLVNAICLSLALAVFIRVIKPDLERLVWLLLVQVVFAPLLMWHLTSLVEVMSLAMAVLVSAAFYSLITVRPPTWRQAAFALIVVTIATLVRPMMGVFFIPLGLLLQRRNSVMSIGVGLVVGALLCLGVCYAVMLTSSPYPFLQWRAIMATLPDNPEQAWQLTLINLSANLGYFNQAEPPQLFQRAQVVVGIALLGAATVLGFWRAGRRWTGLSAAEAALHLYNLASIFIFYMLLYDIRDWRDFRGEAPHVLFTALLFLAFGRRIWTALFVVSGLLFLPQVVPYYTNWSQTFLSPERQAAYSEWQAKMADVLSYEANAPSPWCNTVTHTGRFFDYPATLLALPSEIAISFVLDANDIPRPPRAQYLLLDESSQVLYADRFARLQPLLGVPGGTLYFNPDSACQEGGTADG